MDLRIGLTLASNDRPPTTPTTPPVSSATIAQINIAARSRLRVAPEAFHFDVTVDGFDATGPSPASDIYDDRYHDLYYYWDFDDAYDYAAPVNLIAKHKNAGVAYGPTASHTFRAAGTYTVSLLVVEPSSGKTASTTLDVTVDDADAQFSGTKTRFVDIGGDFAGKPAGAAEYTTLAAALAAADSGAVPQRIILRRGQTFDLYGQVSMDGGFPALHIVASSGSGAKPIVFWAPGAATRMFFFNRYDPSNVKDFTLENIAIRGNINTTVGTGSSTVLFFIHEDPPHSFLQDACEISNFHIGIQDTGGGAGGAPMKTINDTSFMGWASTCALESKQVSTAYSGCRMVQNPDAIADPAGGNASISCVRVSTAGQVIMDACDTLNFIGWTKFGSHIVQQGAFRFNSAGAMNAKLNVQRCTFEGGWRAFELRSNSGTPGRVTNSVIEKCVFVGTYQTARPIDVEHSGITVRNNIFARPDVVNSHGNFDPNDGVLYAAWDEQDTLTRDAPIRFYNNTSVNLMSAANFTGSVVSQPMSFVSGFTDVTVENNVDHQPNLTMPITGDAPLNSTALWAPLFKGYKDSTTALETQYATPADTVATYAPMAGSAALGDALNDPVAYDDFYGEQRPQYPSRGALEMP